MALRAFLQLWGVGATRQLQSEGFPWRWLLLLRSAGSSALRLQRLWLPGFRAQADRARAELPCSMWGLPRPGIEPVSPASAGGFFTTEP